MLKAHESTENDQFARDLSALIETTKHRIDAIDAAGMALVHEASLIARLQSQIAINNAQRLDLMLLLSTPQATPESERKRGQIERHIELALPRLAGSAV